MTKPDMLNDAELDRLFAAARDDVPEAEAAFVARMLAAAEAEARRPAPGAVRPVAGAPRSGARLRAVLGGWAGISGLVAATVAGFWIGVAPPDVIPDPAGYVGLWEDGLSEQLWFDLSEDTWDMGEG